jgi:ribosomal protein L11 methyltransferase
MNELPTSYYRWRIDIQEPLQDEAIALLSTLDFEGFEQESNYFWAYIDRELDAAVVSDCLSPLATDLNLVCEAVPVRNWNAEWEADYLSVFVAEGCQIYPAYREPEPGYEYNICITPQMSFGTGHHETTRLMVEQMLGLSLDGKRVLDMGCGTGVLGILAGLRGATEVVAIDNDPIAVDNARANFQQNGIHYAEVMEGSASEIPALGFEVILANINRNVLLADGHAYVNHLQAGGYLAISGFFDVDSLSILDYFLPLNMNLIDTRVDNHWVCHLLQKTASC